MPEQPKDPAPAAKPAYTIIKQKHSRWWEVRDFDDEPGLLIDYRNGGER
jgi:hypothetical protein